MIQFLSATGSASLTETLFTLLPMILIIVFMFILIYLPQKRQDKKDAAMRSSIEIGDKVTTIGGIVGRVVTVKDDSLIIETGAERNRIKIMRWAISTNNTANEKLEAERAAAKEAQEAEKAAKMEEAKAKSKASRKKSKKNKDADAE